MRESLSGCDEHRPTAAADVEQLFVTRQGESIQLSAPRDVLAPQRCAQIKRCAAK
jgi:hypothetical protein